MHRSLTLAMLACTGLAMASLVHAQAKDNGFIQGYATPQKAAQLQDELLYQRAVQAYLWALPALNMVAMKEGSERVFGKGYNVLPIFKERLNAKTLVTTPNSDVIYAMGYVDLAETGPLVIEVPPGLQGILDDFYQRPVCMEKPLDGKRACGDVGLPGPDKGKGGKYLVLPPDYTGSVPDQGYYTYRSRTYGLFVFWRGFFKDPKDLEPPVKVMEQTRIYPLGKESTAKPMVFPDASSKPANMLYPTDGSAFDMLARYVDHEYVDPQDMEMRGVLATLGIVKGQPFKPDAHTKQILDRGARTAYQMTRALGFQRPDDAPAQRYYPDRHWMNPFPDNADFTTPTYNEVDARTKFFALAYSTSPGMAINMENVGAKYPFTAWDVNNQPLSGSKTYRLRLPKGIPAALFWSVTAYDSVTASGLDNGQPFPSLNQMDKPAADADGTTEIWFGPTRPKGATNWIRTVPGKGYFVLLRLYGPTKTFFDKSWVPGDFEPQG
ncbi:DUF1254 domain-containing protein [Dyella solisilvae]|uniref:DUF1254 domain-containing protein n=1 Tax=Dyella solisilvae TaxID=1920168 RepID=A0A370K539_9GAMM|nr:DUF1254 domain-containing protein [Dyella solisilvae]RDI97753.1 DUF1254 domain-containing protein [Dyella solisilvae]